MAIMGWHTADVNTKQESEDNVHQLMKIGGPTIYLDDHKMKDREILKKSTETWNSKMDSKCKL